MSPDQFTFTVSFTVLAMVVLGGMGNFWGVAIGAFVDLHDPTTSCSSRSTSSSTPTGVPILKDIDFIQLQFLLYGLALVAMMLLRPEGLFPNSRRKRELHTRDDGSRNRTSCGSVPERRPRRTCRQ